MREGEETGPCGKALGTQQSNFHGQRCPGICAKVVQKFEVFLKQLLWAPWITINFRPPLAEHLLVPCPLISVVCSGLNNFSRCVFLYANAVVAGRAWDSFMSSTPDPEVQPRDLRKPQQDRLWGASEWGADRECRYAAVCVCYM